MTDSPDTPTSSYTIPPRPAHVREAEDWVAKALRETAGALGVEMVDRPDERHPDSPFRERIPAPPHGLLAALTVRAAALKQTLEQAEHARAVGFTWWELADALPEKHAVHGDPVALFELLVPEPLTSGYSRHTSWRCTSCDKLVIDSGPYNNNVDDDEKGHAENCARHRTDRTKQEARAAEQDW